ncbi:cation transporter [Patescibacteria group bacterium]|nr:cation transporter [Patescibacteria group bacterium]
MAEINLKIEGMHCGACATGIQMIAMGLEGVTKAFIDYDKKEGTFTFDEAKVSKEKIIEEIEKSGYNAS